MVNQMFKRTGPVSAMGVSMGFLMAALLIGAGSVHPQTTTPSDAESGSEMQSGTQSSGTSGTSSGAASATPGKTLSTSDRNMMRQLAYANMSEVALAKLAQSKTSDEKVRDFSQRMIDDHGKALEQLQSLAQAKGVQLPTAPDAKHQALEKKFNALSGQEFDRQYMQQAGMRDHHQVHNLLERISTRAQSPELKALAADMLPTIDQHAQMAQQIHSDKEAQTSSGK